MNQGGRDDSYRIYDCDELRISFRSSVRPSFCALLSQRHAPPVANNKIPTYLLQRPKLNSRLEREDFA